MNASHAESLVESIEVQHRDKALNARSVANLQALGGEHFEEVAVRV